MSDEAGLLGFDPEMQQQMQEILRQMGPSEVDRKQALNMGWLNSSVMRSSRYKLR